MQSSGDCPVVLTGKCCLLMQIPALRPIPKFPLKSFLEIPP